MLFSGVKFIMPKTILLKSIKHGQKQNYLCSVTSSLIDRGITSKDSIEKEICIEQQKSNTSNNIYNVETNIKTLTLDSTKIKQEKIIRKLHALTHKLVLEVSESGNITSVANHSEIIKQWEQLKLSLVNKFKGTVVVKYLQGIEDKINNKQKLLDDINQYRLFGFIWNSLYRSFSSPIKKQKIHLQVVDYLSIIIDETYNWMGNDKENPIKIEMKGSINKEQTAINKMNTYFKRKGYIPSEFELVNYEGNYKIDKDTGWVSMANFNMTLKYGNEYLKTQTINIEHI